MINHKGLNFKDQIVFDNWGKLTKSQQQAIRAEKLSTDVITYIEAGNFICIVSLTGPKVISNFEISKRGKVYSSKYLKV